MQSHQLNIEGREIEYRFVQPAATGLAVDAPHVIQ